MRDNRIKSTAARLITAVLLAIPAAAAGGNLTDSLSYDVRLGYNLGGTAPIGLPASIRGMNKYDPKYNLSYGFDVWKDVRGPWGVLTGLHLENKGMMVDAEVKGYRMKIVRGGQSLEGVFTGNNVVEVEQWLLTVPVMGTYAVNRNLRVKFGPYVSYALSRRFSGYAYDGYLRVGNPTGDRVDIGNDESTRGTYDFSDDMRRLQIGIDLGADWYFSRRWGVYTDISWGLTGIHKSSFDTIEQTLYPIYGTLGVIYKLK